MFDATEEFDRSRLQKKMGSVDGMGWCILASDLVIVVEWLVLLCR